jgi:hypothetical protein
MQGVSKELYDGVPNVVVWRVLRKHLHLKACKLSIVQGVEMDGLYGFKCKRFLNTRPIVKLFLKHPV